MFVEERFQLRPEIIHTLRSTPYSFGFDGFGELVYMRTYSRLKDDGSQEQWPDNVIRVISGVMSIRKDWYRKHVLPWNEDEHQQYAGAMALAMLKMHWLPPGRGLWAMGTNYVYERGAGALSNCGARAIHNDTMDRDFAWVMDMLMLGCGVGVECLPGPELRLQEPEGPPDLYLIPDSREGWVDATRRLIRSYIVPSRPVEIDYSLVRPRGAPIKSFGGTASGPEPLRDLHSGIRGAFSEYMARRIDRTRLVADITNMIGSCVVSGNVRRSALILIGEPGDVTFRHLKDYDRFPERKAIGWVSNNSIRLGQSDHFELIPELAERILDNGEPGLLNLINMQKFARYGRVSVDPATTTNPCGEVPLESGELCNLAESFPTRCESEEAFLQSCEYATFYTSTVALLPTHQPETNAVIARNRRIGVSISGIVDWIQRIGSARATRLMRKAYDLVEATNRTLAAGAGVPPSIRRTTVKPSGTISNLVGCPPGMNFSPFNHAIRRARVGHYTPIGSFLRGQGMPWEPDLYSRDTDVFSFPIKNSSSRSSTEVSVWEQASLLAMLQREWADNSVSTTLCFNRDTEAGQVQHVLAQVAPLVKSLSMLPHMKDGVYEQSPYTGITEAEYRESKARMPILDWSKFSGSDGDQEADKFCSSASCEWQPAMAGAAAGVLAGGISGGDH